MTIQLHKLICKTDHWCQLWGIGSKTGRKKGEGWSKLLKKVLRNYYLGAWPIYGPNYATTGDTLLVTSWSTCLILFTSSPVGKSVGWGLILFSFQKTEHQSCFPSGLSVYNMHTQPPSGSCRQVSSLFALSKPVAAGACYEPFPFPRCNIISKIQSQRQSIVKLL